MNTKTKVLPGAPQDSAAAQAGSEAAGTADEVKKKSAADVVGADEFAGKGGSYTFDPDTQARAPTAETVEHLAKHKPKEEKKESK